MKTLVAGFGNLLLGDDGFGVEVVRRLTIRGVPENTEVIEVGIGGFDFVLKLMDGFERAVIVDALRRGDEPGKLTIFEPSVAGTTLRSGEGVDPHVAEPSRALALARTLKVLPGKVTIVGCELYAADVGIGLSPVVAASVDRALDAIESILRPCPSNS